MQITIKLGTSADMLAALQILNEAKTYFKLQNINQWQDENGYPNEIDLNEDMKNKAWYVAKINDEIVATFMADVQKDETYEGKPANGEWLISGKKYGVLHRIAVSGAHKGKGIAGQIVNFTCEMCKQKGAFSLKSDTHKDNINMQKMLVNNGFIECGGIILPNGAPRIIFEKTL